MKDKINENEFWKSNSYMVFTGCMMLGMALGWYFNAFLPFMFGGMGIGFLVTVIIKSKNN